MVAYRVSIANAATHRYRVDLTVHAQDLPLTVSLPVWIPGSYMVREFARHLSGLTARRGTRTLHVTAMDKATWRIDDVVDARDATGARPPRRATPVVLSYEVYAFDTSVRAAYLDPARGFFNGTSLFLRVHGQEHATHTVSFGPLPRGWRIATGMPALAVGKANQAAKVIKGAKATKAIEKAPKAFAASGYDALVDHPFELGTFWHGHFTARGVPHELVVAGAWPNFDGARLLADTQRICEAQLDFWHGQGVRAAQARDVPFKRYVFMLNAVDEGYGGLEHRASTALIACRRDLPRLASAATAASSQAMEAASTRKPDAYITLLGLISHEYFHTWNVKRLTPAELATIDYTRENTTELLWFFEGFTSYYDDLMLRRAGLISDEQYLRLVAQQLSTVLATPGRHAHSVARASFDAWIKYYRSDENTPNATVSYYAKGALVALALDLTLQQSGASLDDAMRWLWQQPALDAHGTRPVTEGLIADALRAVAGRSMARELKAWVHGTADAPWAALLERAGVSTQHEAAATLSAAWGLRLTESAATGAYVKNVLRGGAGEAAGLMVGDELLAVDGWRVRKLDDAKGWLKHNDAVALTIVRQQRLLTLRLKPVTPAATVMLTGKVSLTLTARPDAATLRRRQRWLQGS
jgi:predicted metalloprotease with PDZ domain